MQEIFGVTEHIREMADEYAGDGYEVLAPALFDREHPGFEAAYSGPDFERAVELARKLHPFEQSMKDVQTCIDALKAKGPVFVVGYCYGGSVAWLSSTRLTGVTAASGYYGSLIPQFADEEPKVPVIAHFGRFDSASRWKASRRSRPRLGRMPRSTCTTPGTASIRIDARITTNRRPIWPGSARWRCSGRTADNAKRGADMNRAKIALAALLAVGVAPAGAESVKSNGTFVAKARDVAMLRSLTIERFAGRDGQALTIAFERRLAASGHFRLSPGGASEGVVSGAVSTGVESSPFRKRRKTCAEKIEKKCVREVEEEIRCLRRTIEFQADVRVTDRVADRVVFSAPVSRREEGTWCGDEAPTQSAETIVRSMIDDVAGELAATFTPRTERYSVKVLESDKGMTKEQKAAFKASVKLTKTDLPAACASWAEQDRAMPNYPSLVFNLGLCAEATGNFAEAERLYLRPVRWAGDAKPTRVSGGCAT